MHAHAPVLSLTCQLPLHLNLQASLRALSARPPSPCLGNPRPRPNPLPFAFVAVVVAPRPRAESFVEGQCPPRPVCLLLAPRPLSLPHPSPAARPPSSATAPSTASPQGSAPSYPRPPPPPVACKLSEPSCCLNLARLARRPPRYVHPFMKTHELQPVCLTCACTRTCIITNLYIHGQCMHVTAHNICFKGDICTCSSGTAVTQQRN